MWRFSNINVVSSHKEVVVCRSAAGAFRAFLGLFFCLNCVFVIEKGMTPDWSGLLGWRIWVYWKTHFDSFFLNQRIPSGDNSCSSRRNNLKLFTYLLDTELILWGEILSWSLMGVKGSFPTLMQRGHLFLFWNHSFCLNCASDRSVISTMSGLKIPSAFSPMNLKSLSK